MSRIVLANAGISWQTKTYRIESYHGTYLLFFFLSRDLRVVLPVLWQNVVDSGVKVDSDLKYSTIMIGLMHGKTKLTYRKQGVNLVIEAW